MFGLFWPGNHGNIGPDTPPDMARVQTRPQVLRDDHEGIAVYIAPSKALVNQAEAERCVAPFWLEELDLPREQDILTIPGNNIVVGECQKS